MAIRPSEFARAKLLKSQNFTAAIILIVVLALFYRDVVFGGRTFLVENGIAATMPYPPGGPYNYAGVENPFSAIDVGAIAWVGEPFNRFISQSIQRGDFPLWNPYAGPAGTPLLADGQTAPLEPIQFLFFFIPTQFWPFAIDLQLLIRFFIAGFFTYLFSRRLKVDLLGSLSAGFFFMLGTYFFMYGNHMEVKTEALLPVVLYGYDRLADPQDKTGAWLCALFIGWALIAGMPESVVFTLALGTLWYFYRSLVKRDRHNTLKKTLFNYAVFTTFGFLISAAYLLPFFEFVLQSKSVHLGGSGNLANLTFPAWLVTNLILQSPSGLFQHVRLGFVPIFALIYSIMSLKDWPQFREDLIFFGAYVCLSLLLLFHFPFTDWVFSLPIIRQVGVWKYAFPSILFCSGMVMGVFIHQVKTIPLSYKKIAVALILILLLIIWLPLRFASRSLSVYFLNQILALDFLGFRLLAFLVIGLLAFAYLSRNRWIDDLLPLGSFILPPGNHRAAQITQFGLTLLLLSEPFYWSFLKQRPSRADSYQPPPFVTYLKKDDAPFRVFAMDNTMYPNISTAYQIGDVRWLNALVTQRAYDFSTSLIAPDEPDAIRFTGTIFPISDRMFDLLNVKYVLVNDYNPPAFKAPGDCPAFSNGGADINEQPVFATLDNQILAQNSHHRDLREERLAINGSTRFALSAFAPASFKLALSIPPESSSLAFSIGLRSDVFKPNNSDGVIFKVNLSDGNNKTTLFSKYINPSGNPCDRQWFDEILDLKNWAGKDVVLSFLTDVGPSGSNNWDFSYWGNILLIPTPRVADATLRSSAQPHYTQTYEDANVLMYQNNEVMPRSFVVYKAVNASNFNEAIKLLSDPDFDLKNTAVVENLPPALTALIDRNPPEIQFSAAKSKLVKSGEVDVELQTKAPGLLVLSDQYYPGWQAWVDGKPAHIYAVDGIFRGVFLNEGSHMVRFEYRPLSFTIGAIISIIALSITMVCLTINSWSSPKPHE